jgi:hypothetical protein
MTSVLIVLGLATVGLLFALFIDGVISRKMADRAENAIGDLRAAHRKESLEKLADFPFKKLPCDEPDDIDYCAARHRRAYRLAAHRRGSEVNSTSVVTLFLSATTRAASTTAAGNPHS